MKTSVARILIYAALALAILAAALSPALATAATVSPAPGSALLQNDAAPDDWQTAGDEPTPSSTTPPYEGLALYTDAAAGFRLWFPNDWQVAQSTGTDGNYSLVMSKPGRPDVRFSVTARAIDRAMTIFDLPAMTAAFDSLLAGSQTAWQARWHRGLVRGFEALSTIAGSDQEITRWVCLRYQGERQYWLAAEAPSVAAFDANEFAFRAMMYTFKNQ